MKPQPIFTAALGAALALALAAPSAFAFDGDAEAGAAKATVCAACHGPDGNSVIPANPSLAGQNYSYLVQTMKDYRDGRRNNAIMNAQSTALTDADIANLAKYYSAQPGRLVDLKSR